MCSMNFQINWRVFVEFSFNDFHRFLYLPQPCMDKFPFHLLHQKVSSPVQILDFGAQVTLLCIGNQIWTRGSYPCSQHTDLVQDHHEKLW